MRFAGWLVIPFIVGGTLGAQTLFKSANREEVNAVAAVLDDWHLAAAQFEEERYFSHLAPEAVFVGIDEHERWPKAAFRKWAHQGFVSRQMWNFKSAHRDITLSPSGEVAWFDELLDTTSIGTARGAGVLVKDGRTWLITQYVLSLPIPREAFVEIRQMIAAQKTISAPQDAKKPSSGK
jgi:ketosteroid isomerase-like protein